MEAIIVVIAGLIVFGLYRWLRRGSRRADIGSGEEGAQAGSSADERETPGFGVENVVRTSAETERVRQLFKDATTASAEDPNKAVTLFRKAREQAALTGMDQGIDVFLRLPRYLQEGGRSEEGWQELNDLLTSGYPNMPEGDRAWRLKQSAVYDKMRLFLQREKRFSSAVLFGGLSIIFDIKAVLTEWPEARYIQNLEPLEPLSEAGRERAEKNRLAKEQRRRKDRQRDLEHAKSLRRQDHSDKELTKLLQRAKLLERHDEALAVLWEWAKAQPEGDDREYEKRFNQALGLCPQLSGLSGRVQLSHC